MYLCDKITPTFQCSIEQHFCLSSLNFLLLPVQYPLPVLQSHINNPVSNWPPFSSCSDNHFNHMYEYISTIGITYMIYVFT